MVVDLIMGLDIGSSTTKVVIRQAWAGDDNFYVVDFKEFGQPGATYLLPTALCFDENTNSYFVPDYNQVADYEDIKYKFMQGAENSDIILSAFIAWVMQYSKKYFLKRFSETDAFRGREIKWSVNMGVPTAVFNDEGNEKWIKVLEKACRMHVDEPISTNSLKRISRPDIDLHVIPEIIATIKSFVAQDGANNDGLYCAIDVGATTLDACTFRIFGSDTGEDKYAFYSARIKPYGAARYEESQDKNEFLRNCDKQFSEVIWGTYLRKAPHEKEWCDGLPVILCGGGSYIPEYKKLLTDYDEEHLKRLARDRFGNEEYKGIRYVRLPDNHYVSEQSVDQKRLLVAQGLSYPYIDFDDIKRIYQTCETEDVPIITTDNFRGNEYITKDMC